MLTRIKCDLPLWHNRPDYRRHSPCVYVHKKWHLYSGQLSHKSHLFRQNIFAATPLYLFVTICCFLIPSIYDSMMNYVMALTASANGICLRIWSYNPSRLIEMTKLKYIRVNSGHRISDNWNRNWISLTSGLVIWIFWTAYLLSNYTPRNLHWRSE